MLTHRLKIICACLLGTLVFCAAPIAEAQIFITSYDFDDGEAYDIATKYKFVVTNLDEASAVTDIKAINPNIKAVHYDNALTHGTTYYVLDAVTEKKIIHDTWGWYLMDISNATYRSNLAAYIAANLSTYSQFDGVFLDDVWVSTALSASDFHQEGTEDDPTLPTDLVTNWETYMTALLSAIKTAIGSDLLIINANWSATGYLSEADGQMDENFAHANWEGPTEFLDVTSWQNHISAMLSAVAAGKYYLAQSGVTAGATEAQIAQLVRYTHASYLMGVTSASELQQHYFVPSLTYSDVYWYNDFDIYVADPEGAYAAVSGESNCYKRVFEGGIAVVNVDDSEDCTASLGGSYYNTSGNLVTSVIVPPRDGAILHYFPYLVDSTTFYAYSSSPEPPKGVPFRDPIHHTLITRITDYTDLTGATSSARIYCGYPKHDIENADGTKILIQTSIAGPQPGGDGTTQNWTVYNASPPYEKLRNLPGHCNAASGLDVDVRWDTTDPNLVYYCIRSASGQPYTSFYMFNVSTGTETLLRNFVSDFPAGSFSNCMSDPIYVANMYEEGSPDDTSRYWAFQARCPNLAYGGLFVWDKDFYGENNGKVISFLDWNDPLCYQTSYGFVSMSPSGNYVWTGDAHVLYSRDLTSINNLYTQTQTANHADMGYDAENREVVAWGKSSRPGYSGAWTTMTSAADSPGIMTWLTPVVGGYHVSANSHARPGWAVYSVYEPNYPTAPTQWSHHSIFMVELTRRTNPLPHYWRIAHTHMKREDYRDDPFAKINRAGTKIYFSSGWGGSVASNEGQNVYMIELPSTWYQDFGYSEGGEPEQDYTLTGATLSGCTIQ